MPEALRERDQDVIWHPFTQHATARPVMPIKSAKGARLYGEDGKEYLDLISSWWVNTHGHAHPAIAEAIYKQASQLEQVIFAGFTHEPAVQLAEKLLGLLPDGFSKVFFTDNGSTAIEAAMKMSCQYWHNNGQPQKKKFIAFEGAYHGDTFGAMSVGVGSGFYEPFEDLLMDVQLVPYPHTWFGDENVEEKEKFAIGVLTQTLEQHHDKIAALIVEPLLQGASGMRICRPEFLNKVLSLCKQHNILTTFDEVLTGFGRTGTMFAMEQLIYSPDLVCLSKGLTGGFLPLSVTAVKPHVFEAFKGETFAKALAHGHSYTANPLGCAAACAAIDLYETENTFDKIKKINAVHQQELSKINQLGRHIVAPRAIGSVGAFNIGSTDTVYDRPIGRIIEAAGLEQGLLIRPLGNCVYFLPPFCITPEELQEAYSKLADIITQKAELFEAIAV